MPFVGIFFPSSYDIPSFVNLLPELVQLRNREWIFKSLQISWLYILELELCFTWQNGWYLISQQFVFLYYLFDI